jgi:hypothetical protein
MYRSTAYHNLAMDTIFKNRRMIGGKELCDAGEGTVSCASRDVL